MRPDDLENEDEIRSHLELSIRPVQPMIPHGHIL